MDSALDTIQYQRFSFSWRIFVDIYNFISTSPVFILYLLMMMMVVAMMMVVVMMALMITPVEVFALSSHGVGGDQRFVLLKSRISTIMQPV